MQVVLKAFCLLVLILMARLLFAQSADTDLTTLTASEGLMGNESEPADLLMGGMVKVVTGEGRPADCLAPVAITRIDGERRTVPAQGFLIEPGLHTLNGRASMDISACPVEESTLQISKAADFEMFFEMGASYYLAYDHSSVNPDNWSLVVWKVELPVPPLEDSEFQFEDPIQP